MAPMLTPMSHETRPYSLGQEAGMLYFSRGIIAGCPFDPSSPAAQAWQDGINDECHDFDTAVQALRIAH
jgi:hypothetical protein